MLYVLSPYKSHSLIHHQLYTHRCRYTIRLLQHQPITNRRTTLYQKMDSRSAETRLVPAHGEWHLLSSRDPPYGYRQIYLNSTRHSRASTYCVLANVPIGDENHTARPTFASLCCRVTFAGNNFSSSERLRSRCRNYNGASDAIPAIWICL